MKYILYSYFLLSFLFFFNIKSDRQGIAFYSKKNISSTSSLKSFNGDDNTSIKRAKKIVEEFRYKLSFNEFNAKYVRSKRLVSDEENKVSNILAKVISGFLGEVAYYNLKDSLVFIEKDGVGEKLLIKSSFSSSDWELTKENKIIGNLKCYKATKIEEERFGKSSKKYILIAWYCPRLNFAFGPDGYAGLPGLIVQLKKGDIVTTLDKIEFTRKKHKIKLPPRGVIMSKDDFILYMDEVKKKREYYRKK